MASETAQEIASLLGLLDDSYIELIPLYAHFRSLGVHSIVPLDLLDMNERARRLNSLMTTFADTPTGLFREEIQTALISTCFPRLARAVLLLPPESIKASLWIDLVCRIDMNTPLLSAFVRTSDEAPAMVLRLLEGLATNPPSEAAFRAANGDSSRWTNFLDVVQGCVFDLYPHGLPRSPFP